MKDKLLEYFKGDDLAASTWKNKYAIEGEVTPEEMHRRLAKEFYRIDKMYQDSEIPNDPRLSEYGKNRVGLTEDAIFLLFDKFKYIIPAGSIMATLGSDKLSSLSNCFVIDSPEDSISGIMKQCNLQAQIMKYRGGVGYDISSLRPSGSSVKNAAKTSTGAASFMNLFSMVTNTIAQNGRRGALMLTMHINHPDIEEFITLKQDLSKVTGANVSVKVTNEFMKAVKNDEDYILRWPIDLDITGVELFKNPYNELIMFGEGYIKRVKAKELWDTLIQCAHNTAEPGIMFIDRIHDYSPDGIYPEYKAVSTNPCGEIPMGPYDSCKLMHLNLTSFIVDPFTENAYVNTPLLYHISYELTRLSDNLVDLEIEAIDKILDKIFKDEHVTSDEFVLWSKIRQIAISLRRTGCGFTGLADTLAMLGVKYGSEESITMIEAIMNTIFRAQLVCEVDMAIQRGSYTQGIGLNKVEENDWYEFVSNVYPTEFNRMSQYGRRNISWSTVAPTGTVSLLTQTSSGIEPLFQPYYTRRRKCSSPTDRVDFIDNIGEKYSEFIVVHPMFKQWWLVAAQYTHNIEAGLKVFDSYTKDEINELFKKSPWFECTSNDINYEERIEIQSVIQKYITHAISSTINLPKDVSIKEVNNIYFKAWKEGLKGITVYRDGSRSGILVNDNEEDLFTEISGLKRPKELPADYYEITVKGTQFIVLVGLYANRPYEIFVFKPKISVNLKSHKGKIIKVKKDQYRFDSELIQIDNIENSTETTEQKAHTLLISMLLRHRAPLKFVIKTAKKVDDNITSFSSAMCRVLSKYIGTEEVTSEVCPECGGKLIREAGCEKCLDCGFSKCN